MSCQSCAHLSRCVRAEWTLVCQMCPCTSLRNPLLPGVPQRVTDMGAAPCTLHHPPTPGTILVSWCNLQDQQVGGKGQPQSCWSAELGGWRVTLTTEMTLAQVPVCSWDVTGRALSPVSGLAGGVSGLKVQGRGGERRLETSCFRPRISPAPCVNTRTPLHFPQDWHHFQTGLA